MDIGPICGIAALIIGLAIGIYIGIMESKERAAILEKANRKEFIGTKKSKIFHYYTCKHVKRKYRAGKSFDVTFVSAQEAESKHYRPCRQCIDRLIL